MEKKIYEKPVMQVEEFVANTYCDDCSDESHTMVTYIFKCGNGLDNTWYYIRDANNNWATINKKYFGPADWEHPRPYHYEKCPSYHEITLPKGQDPLNEPDILSGYYLDKCFTDVNEKIPVIIWTEEGTNTHCTVELDPHQWQTVKS